jgi:hypothetical protein
MVANVPNARHCWPGERPGFCCEKGNVQIDVLKDFPDELKKLFSDNKFLDDMRPYNNSLAMASMGIKEHFMSGFSPIVKLQGKFYHRIGSLLPPEGDHPKFAQIWFHDSDQINNRTIYNPSLDVNILQQLQNLLHDVNPYRGSLKSAIELTNADDSLRMVIDAKQKPTAEHIRRYNLPQASEVSVIMPGEQFDHLNVLLHVRDGPM